MSLIYITGPTGSGKSSVLRELEKRGFEAHGVDEEGFADWIDRETGETVPFPHDENPSVHDWYRKHSWALSKERIGELKKRADRESKNIFLSGVADGEDEVKYLFDKVIALSVDEQTIRNRVENRQDNHFGKDPEEMKDILIWLGRYDALKRRLGAIVIDATRPLEQVVSDVVEAAK